MACDLLTSDRPRQSTQLPCWLPNDTWVRFLIVPALAFIALATNREYLADFWHHLARGKAIVESGAMVDRDLFTFTVAGREFQDVNWLTQVIYYRLFEWGGLDLVQVVNALITAITFGWLVCLCHRLCGSWAIAAAVGAASFFGLWQVLTIRPQTFSLLLFVILLDILTRQKRSLLIFAPVIIGLWANLHGAFPAGIMLLGCFALAAAWGEFQEQREGGNSFSAAFAALFVCGRLWLWAGVIIASVGATLVNPYGWRIYQYVGLTSNIAAQRRIDEWLPPSWDQWIGMAWFVSLFVFGGLVVVQRIRVGKWISAREAMLLLCFGLLASRSIRMVAWWLIVLAPVMAVMVGRLSRAVHAPKDGPEEPSYGGERPSRGAAISVAVMALFLLTALPAFQHWNPLLAGRSQPRTEDALDIIHAKLKTIPSNGRVFTRLEWGEYLTWAFHPQHKVFMDGRIEIYPDEVWQEYSDVTTGRPGWAWILKKYDINVLILDPAYHGRTGLLGCVEQSNHWHRVAECGPAVLYVRKNE